MQPLISYTFILVVIAFWPGLILFLSAFFK